MSKHTLFNSSIGRKFTMALSAMFLMIFLVIHLTINLFSVFSPTLFNEASFFMSDNMLIQFLMQPVLMFGVLYHFIMGFILEIKNRKARGNIKYAMDQKSHSSTWMSRNMVISGGLILIFIFIHFYDFWIPTINAHYIAKAEDFGQDNYFMEHLLHKFQDPIRVSLYVVGFIFLMLHLLHGFQSSFQSIGANHKKYTPIIKLVGNAYAIIIPLGFIFIALYHYLTQL